MTKEQAPNGHNDHNQPDTPPSLAAAYGMLEKLAPLDVPTPDERHPHGENRPLLVEDIPEAFQTEEFKKIKDKYSWPTKFTDCPPGQTLQYTDDEFAYYLFGDGQYDEARGLNNFASTLSAGPLQTGESGYIPTVGEVIDTGGINAYVYGAKPAVIRADLLAPELFEHLKTVFSEQDRDARNQRLVSEEGKSAVRAARIAYELIGSLVMAEDDSTQKRLHGVPGTSKLIADTHEYLVK